MVAKYTLPGKYWPGIYNFNYIQQFQHQNCLTIITSFSFYEKRLFTHHVSHSVGRQWVSRYHLPVSKYSKWVSNDRLWIQIVIYEVNSVSEKG